MFQILIVDDSKFNQLILSKVVERHKFICTTAFHGLEAIEQMSKKRFDLVFMDILMPKLNGIEAVLQIRETFPIHQQDMPIIALSAMKEIVTQADFQSCNFDDFVLKPISVKIIEQVFSKYLTGNDSVTLSNKAKYVQTESAVYNLTSLREIAENDEVFVKNTVELHINNSQEIIGNLFRYFSENNWEAMYSELHRFLPRLSFLGVDIEDFDELKQLIKANQNKESVLMLLSKLKKLNNNVVTQLKQEFSL